MTRNRETYLRTYMAYKVRAFLYGLDDIEGRYLARAAYQHKRRLGELSTHDQSILCDEEMWQLANL